MSKKSLLVNLLVPTIIYLIGLGMAVGFSLNNDYTAVSDASREYELYTDILKKGYWEAMPGYMLSSSVIVVYFPTVIQRLLSSDPLLTYKIVHSVMVSFLPVAVYFLAKNYVEWKYAILSTILLMAHPYSMVEPKFARMGIALTFFALMMMIIFCTKLRAIYKIPLLAVCAVGIVMSHYGTAYLSLFILGVSWLAIMRLHIVRGVTFRHKVSLTIALCSLVVAATLWLGVMENTPWRTAKGFAQESLGTNQFSQPNQSVVLPQEAPRQAIILAPIEKPSVVKEFLNLDSREQVVQAAFGRTLSTANTPQRIEFVFSWLVVLILSYGLFVAIKKRMFPKEYLVIASVSYITILLAIALPHISIYYSVVRVYFLALSLLGICFVVGGMDLSKRLRLHPSVVPLSVLMGYTLSTSGILHQFFGLSRWSF